MNGQGKAVRPPVSGPGSRQTSGRPPQPRPVQQSGSRGRVRHGNGASDKQREDRGASSHTFEEAEAVSGDATVRERSRTGGSGATPMRRPEPNWRSRADAAAKIPNPMYASNAGTTPMQQPQSLRSRADAAAKIPNHMDASSADGAYPGRASGRRGVCGFLSARRSSLTAGIAVLLGLGAMGLAPLTFINKQSEQDDMSTTVDALKSDQDDMSTTVDALKRDQNALKRDLDNERSRTAALEQRLREIVKALLSCAEGYTKRRGICYKVFNKQKTFTGAASTCRADGGTLAMPRDADTNAFLISLYKSVSDDRGFWFRLLDQREEAFWFGLHDQRVEGRFEWVDGSALGPYNSWSPGEPSNGGGNEDCVIYSPRYKDKWNDVRCHIEVNFICQANPGTYCVRTFS
ncbi:PREDICTED: pulmonary surfactant-associated protein D-like [Branchiostoma belcheri]|uniref:Pulmonary surfactant-associated protein D-like n=1 Tax=Branchiostoma belcheri TaxID=7741 RepID=A0A6P4YEU4_BRABE|nr:PREDICTED: pulmonary surfactant-associated protein D-like [Branchiostoma belcheri]